MLQPGNFALFFTVALLAVTVYFLLGSVPLLTLKHDNPVDARFIRSFYITYYRFALGASTGTAFSYALAARPGFALGAAGIAGLTWKLRRSFIPAMDALGAQIQEGSAHAVAGFRRIHTRAIQINLGQLAVILASLILSSLR